MGDIQKDPLQEIIERYAFASDRPSEQVILDEYCTYLKNQGVFIPLKFRQVFLEDIRSEIQRSLKGKVTLTMPSPQLLPPSKKRSNHDK